MTAIRRIAHLDMDAFYASVELQRYPELKGLAVVIGGRSVSAPSLQADGSYRFTSLGDYNGRGVVTTSTYPARAFGVFSAMGLMKAAKLAPDAILLPADFESYRHYSRLFKAAVADIVTQIEDRGIDEIYFDLSDHIDDALTLAKRIKQAVYDATNLSCSIGIAPNKLLAKIASDLEKPNGITILTEADLSQRIWPLSIRKINGIGPKAGAKLIGLNIHTIGDLAVQDPVLLQQNFGLHYAQWLLKAANGIDNRPLETHGQPKSMSRETTFERDLHAQNDRSELSGIFTNLCERLADDLSRKGYQGKTIGIKIRYQDFSIVTRDVSLPYPTKDASVIRRAGGECLKKVNLKHKLRLLGVRISGLSKSDAANDHFDCAQIELGF
jgi:DNA polymerase-4